MCHARAKQKGATDEQCCLHVPCHDDKGGSSKLMLQQGKGSIGCLWMVCDACGLRVVTDV